MSLDRLLTRNLARKGSSDSEPFSESEANSNRIEYRRHAGEAEKIEIPDETSNEENADQLGSNRSDEGSEEESTSIAFGALVKAQAISPDKRKRHETIDKESPNLGTASSNATESVNYEALERRAGKKDDRDFARNSKHAPTELSSKKAVSRKRSVIPVRKIDHRDPRFEPLSGVVDEQKLKKNYSFLDTYRDSEMAELKVAIRKTHDIETKEKLKRALLSMESRKKAQQIKDHQQAVLSKHRREEKEKIQNGKKPFYLKKADQKKLALVQRFEGMKSRQIEKVIERRRRKVTAKERKAMPDERRG